MENKTPTEIIEQGEKMGRRAFLTQMGMGLVGGFGMGKLFNYLDNDAETIIKRETEPAIRKIDELQKLGVFDANTAEGFKENYLKETREKRLDEVQKSLGAVKLDLGSAFWAGVGAMVGAGVGIGAHDRIVQKAKYMAREAEKTSGK